MNEENRSPELISLTAFAKKNADKGVWPDAYSTVYHIYRQFAGREFSGVFTRLGGITLVDEEKFWDALIRLRQQQAQDGTRPLGRLHKKTHNPWNKNSNQWRNQ